MQEDREKQSRGSQEYNKQVAGAQEGGSAAECRRLKAKRKERKREKVLAGWEAASR